MTNKAYRAKQWLNRNYNDHRQLEADRRMLDIMENRLGSGVARYENDGTGSHDADKSRARHEDALIEFSIQKAKVEREEKKLLAEMNETRSAISKLENPEHIAIATDRYISRLPWGKIANLEHISVATAYRKNKEMLEEMAKILY